MNVHASLTTISCPYCGSDQSAAWAEERGYHVVRCGSCALLFVNPAPAAELVTAAVRTGFHGDEEGTLDVRSRRSAKKVDHYERLFRSLFADIWARPHPIHWLDVGAGYGELIEAVGRLASAGSTIEGLEPMAPKAESARARGLTITQDFLRRDHAPVDFVSSIDVFSHIPDYRAFLADVTAVLKPGGEMVVETGNLADMDRRADFPNELGLPDHLVFGGRKHVVGYLEEAGFDIINIVEQRFDNALNLAKSVAKKVLGRPALLRLPYTSAYRQLVVRARFKG